MSERNLAKNTVFYSVALAGQKALAFVYFIVLARSINVEDQGRFSFALSFASIFAMFLDLGLTSVLIRETAKSREDSEKQLASIIGFKLLASVVIYGIIFVTINVMGYPALTKELVYVSGLVMLLDSLSLSVYGAIRGHQNLFFESVGVILNQLAVMALGITALLLKMDLRIVMAAYLIGSLFNFIWSVFNLRRKFQVKTRINFNWQLIGGLLAMSAPFALAGIFNRIFSSIDVVLLSKLSGDFAVGIYSVAFKIAFALQFVALAFSASLYPAFSHYFAHSQEKLVRLFEKSMYWLIFLSLPLAGGVMAIADQVVGQVFGSEYYASVLPLQILMASMIFVFLCFPVGALLNACNRQSRHTFNLGLTAAFSFLANLILIPLFGYNGSAAANLLSYLLLFTLGIIVAGQVINYDRKFLWLAFIKSFLTTLAMMAAVWWLKLEWHFIIVIAIGTAVYFAVAYLLKLYSVKSIKDFAAEFIKR